MQQRDHPRRAAYAWALLLGPALGGGIAEVLKLSIRRLRPNPDLFEYVFRPFADGPWSNRGMGMPSSHVLVAFTGAALALNIFTGGGRFNAEQIVPQIVALGVTRELAPVLTALILAGRVSATIAAEIGAMRATEQLDAMRTLSTDPFRYLIAPRLLAGVVTIPLLTGVADLIGIAGGLAVSASSLGFNPEIYARSTVEFLTLDDVTSGLIKGAVFGFILTLMGCYHGYRSVGGAAGVGRAATQAMVWSGVLIFASDYLLTRLFTAS